MIEVLGALKGRRSEMMEIGFEVGVLVWGKVKSHPWWPGRTIDEATASSSVKQTKIVGFLFVAFFGDNTDGWLVTTELLLFELHYHEKSKIQTQAFLVAVQEAIYKVNKRAAPGLACRCLDPFNFKPASAPGLLQVDLCGYKEGAIYSMDQVEWSPEEFPVEMLSFLQQLGLRPINTHSDGDSLKVPFAHQLYQILWRRHRNMVKVINCSEVIFSDIIPTCSQFLQKMLTLIQEPFCKNISTWLIH